MASVTITGRTLEATGTEWVEAGPQYFAQVGACAPSAWDGGVATIVHLQLVASSGMRTLELLPLPVLDLSAGILPKHAQPQITSQSELHQTDSFLHIYKTA